MYAYVHMIIMSDIEQLQILIQQDEERGDELAEKIRHERRLLEEAEHQKLTIMRKILEQKLDELKKENMMKEQKLIEIQKCKASMLGEVHELEEQFATRLSYLVSQCIFSCIF